MDTYAQRAIAHIRKNGRMTVDEIAQHCKVSRQAVYKWIWGGDCKEHHEAMLMKLSKLATSSMNLRRAQKAAIHVREAVTHLELAISAMGQKGTADRWTAYWPDYQKAVKTMLRVRGLSERFEHVLERHHHAEKTATAAIAKQGARHEANS